ncbi:MAG: GTPase HflX [Deltaproteobacteria bacterium]|nr:MAG: GTPase HflX [Deltaproteobacteria bacterium]
MKKIFGNTGGLKANQIHRLENLYRRRIPPAYILTSELALEMSRLSREISRQIGLMINRTGNIIFVIVGDHQGIVIPDTSDYRVDPGRLRGLRCIHTHLSNESLTKDDLTDLALLRLDIIASIRVTPDGLPAEIHMGHIAPKQGSGEIYQTQILKPNELDIGCLELIRALETEFSRSFVLKDAAAGKERALLVSVSTDFRQKAEESLEELKELTESCGIEVASTILQHRKKIDPRFLMGRGKLSELSILAVFERITMVIFDTELNPAQIRSITDQVDLKIIDRTQLILDIFAQRAQSREGKLQVELAQMKYLLPRLVTKNTAMSRLTGGIGGRGPGETKLEINRRRVRDRIHILEKALDQVLKQRKQQKSKRNKQSLPVISIVGYTNAGKSTLLNTLTKSNVLVENRLFATLDPSSRRMRFPREMEVIITDTVGFIRNLPKELMVAFRATLEELESADLLLHVIDLSNPRFEDQIQSVDKILEELNLERIPILCVLNKQDLVPEEMVEKYCRQYKAIPISATNASTLTPMIEKMESIIHDISFPYS